MYHHYSWDHLHPEIWDWMERDGKTDEFPDPKHLVFCYSSNYHHYPIWSTMIPFFKARQLMIMVSYPPAQEQVLRFLKYFREVVSHNKSEWQNGSVYGIDDIWTGWQVDDKGRTVIARALQYDQLPLVWELLKIYQLIAKMHFLAFPTAKRQMLPEIALERKHPKLALFLLKYLYPYGGSMLKHTYRSTGLISRPRALFWAIKRNYGACVEEILGQIKNSDDPEVSATPLKALQKPRSLSIVKMLVEAKILTLEQASMIPWVNQKYQEWQEGDESEMGEAFLEAPLELVL